MAEGVGDPFRLYVVKQWEGWARTMSGDPSRGRALFEEATGLADQIGTKFQLGRCRAGLAAGLLDLGDLEGVESSCQAALRDAEQSGDRAGLALAWRTLAEVVARSDPPDPMGVDDSMQAAIRVQEEIGERPELARTYASYAAVLRARGDHTRAGEFLEKATTLFREMGMTWDLARAERERGKLSSEKGSRRV